MCLCVCVCACSCARARVDAGTCGPRGLLLRVTAAWRDDGWSASFTRGALFCAPPRCSPPFAPFCLVARRCMPAQQAILPWRRSSARPPSGSGMLGYCMRRATLNRQSAAPSRSEQPQQQQRSSRGAAGEQQGGNLGDPTLGARAATVDMSGVPGEGGQGKGGKIRGSGGHEARAGSGRGGSAGFPWPPVGCCARCCARCCNHSYPTLCMSGASALGAQGAVRLRWGARGRCATSMTARVLGLVRTRLCVRLRFPLPVLTCLPEISRPRSHLEVR